MRRLAVPGKIDDDSDPGSNLFNRYAQSQGASFYGERQRERKGERERERVREQRKE